jgi:signal transduction histidine kinase/GAF domain-containing protein
MLASLARVSQVITSTVLLDDVLRIVLAEGRQQTLAIGGQINLYQPHQNRFQPHLKSGWVAHLPEAEHAILESQESRHIYLHPADHHDPDQPSLDRLAILQPILFQGEVAGLLEFFYAQTDSLPPQTDLFVLSLARQAAIAIGNARRFKEITERNTLLQRRIQQIEQVVEASRVIHGERTLPELYEEVVYAIQEGTGFNLVLLSLAEQSGIEWSLRRVMAAGLPLERLREIQETRQSWGLVAQAALPEFQLGNAYYVPAGQAEKFADHPAAINENDAAPAKREISDQWQNHDLFFIPLHDSAGNPLGLISLDAPRDGRRPGQGTAQILEIFANQAAAAIENWRLFHNTREYAQQLRRLHEVSQEVLSETDPPRRLQVLVNGLCAAGWERVTLTLRDADFNATKLVSAGLSPEEHQFLQDNLLPAEVWRERFSDPTFQQFRHGSAYFVPADHPWAAQNIGVVLADHTPPRDVPGAWHPHDMLCLPLYNRQNQPLALIGLDQPTDRHRPDEAKLQIIELYARFAVAVIEGINLFDQIIERNEKLNAVAHQNAQLVAELRELTDELDERVARRTQALHEESERVKILLRISTELTASLDRDRVLSRALGLVNEVVNATQGNILLIDQDTNDLIFFAAFDLLRPQPPTGLKSSVSSREGLAGWVIQNHEPVIIHDTREDERWISRPGTSREHRSVMAVPLITGDEVIGVMMLFHNRPQAFTESLLDLVTAAGIQVANAINNANLYDLIRHQAESLGGMMREAQIEVAKTHAILESIGEGVLVAQADGEIILANLPVEKILDLSRQELVSKRIQELYGRYGSSADTWLDMIAFWSANPDSVQERASHVTQFELADLVISVNVSPVFVHRQYIGTVSIFRDITQEVAVDRMKSEFVSTVSHELRTPMTSIKGYAELLLMGAAGMLNEAQNRYLQVIKKNSDRLHMLVDELLDISRIETGKTQLKRQALDIPQVIQSVTNDHIPGRLQSLEKEINVVLTIAPAIPLADGDLEKVTRILTNLVDNALNYTPDNGQIEVGAQPVNEFIAITVSDNGIGIAADNLEHIFERFYRSEQQPVQAVSGTGLGLAIVKSLVEMHGGTISAESRLGEGSTFTFTLPQFESHKG